MQMKLLNYKYSEIWSQYAFLGMLCNGRVSCFKRRIGIQFTAAMLDILGPVIKLGVDKHFIVMVSTSKYENSRENGAKGVQVWILQSQLTARKQQQCKQFGVFNHNHNIDFCCILKQQWIAVASVEIIGIYRFKLALDANSHFKIQRKRCTPTNSAFA